MNMSEWKCHFAPCPSSLPPSPLALQTSMGRPMGVSGMDELAGCIEDKSPVQRIKPTLRGHQRSLIHEK